MRLSPIRPDLELSGRRAPHSEMTPRKLDGFHKEFAEGVGFFRGGVELRLVVDVEHLHVVLAQPEPPPLRLHMEDDRGEFHEHGPGGLQERVQGRVRGADMQVPPVDADEVGAFARSGEDTLHVVDEPFYGWQ